MQKGGGAGSAIFTDLKISSFSTDFSFFLLLKFTHFLLFSAQFELFYFDFKPFFSFLSIFSVFDKRPFSDLFLAVLHVYHT